MRFLNYVTEKSALLFRFTSIAAYEAFALMNTYLFAIQEVLSSILAQ